LMLVHTATGIAAFGWPAPDALAYLVHLSNNLWLALF
jgi:hypothetical protein